MDRRPFRLIFPLALALALCALWLVPAAAADPAPMAPASVSVATEIEDAAAQALGDNPPITATHYAVTHLSNPSDDYYMLSVAGLSTTTPTDWNMFDDAIWWGNVIVYSDAVTTSAAVAGTMTYTQMISAAYGSGTQESMQLDPLVASATSSEAVYFPWQPGTQAMTGSCDSDGTCYNAHQGCYGLSGDIAIDFFGGGLYRDMPNMIYASQSGTVSRVCQDDYSAGLVIGDFGYLHFQRQVGNNFNEGDHVSRGQALGPLVVGNIPTGSPCGYASQSASSFHVHWCAIPSGGYLRVENWTFDVAADVWRYGSEVVKEREYLTALWNGSAPPSTPMPTVTPGGPTLTPSPTAMYSPPPEVGGASFWDPIVYGISNLIGGVLQATPDHDEIGLATTYVSAAATVFRVSFVLLNSNFNMTVPFFAVGLMLLFESWRIVKMVARKIWFYIEILLKFIPFIG